VQEAWLRALRSDRPVVLDFVTDGAVPPIPPHATLEQVGSTASASLRGDPESSAVLCQGVRAKIQDFLAATGPAFGAGGRGRGSGSDQDADR
jgi:pyruvate dehydrogenase (quinone)